MNQANSPSPKLHSLSRVIEIGYATELHPHNQSVREGRV
jgi:hypothetical protein